jgi:hypothetical protein
MLYYLKGMIDKMHTCINIIESFGFILDLELKKQKQKQDMRTDGQRFLFYALSTKAGRA